MSKTILTYSREMEEYPVLKLVVTEKQVKQNPELITEPLTAETLRMIMSQAGMKEEAEAWPKEVLESLVNDPQTKEPMELLDAEEDEDAKPMTARQLERALAAVEELDAERMAEPRMWDETPM